MNEILKSKIKERLDQYASQRNIARELRKINYRDRAIHEAMAYLLDHFIDDLQWFILHLDHEGEKKHD